MAGMRARPGQRITAGRIEGPSDKYQNEFVAVVSPRPLESMVGPDSWNFVSVESNQDAMRATNTSRRDPYRLAGVSTGKSIVRKEPLMRPSGHVLPAGTGFQRFGPVFPEQRIRLYGVIPLPTNQNILNAPESRGEKTLHREPPQDSTPVST